MAEMYTALTPVQSYQAGGVTTADVSGAIAAQHATDLGTYARVFGAPDPTGNSATDTANIATTVALASASIDAGQPLIVAKGGVTLQSPGARDDE